MTSSARSAGAARMSPPRSPNTSPTPSPPPKRISMTWSVSSWRTAASRTAPSRTAGRPSAPSSTRMRSTLVSRQNRAWTSTGMPSGTGTPPRPSSGRAARVTPRSSWRYPPTARTATLLSTRSMPASSGTTRSPSTISSDWAANASCACTSTASTASRPSATSPTASRSIGSMSVSGSTTCTASCPISPRRCAR